MVCESKSKRGGKGDSDGNDTLETGTAAYRKGHVVKGSFQPDSFTGKYTGTQRGALARAPRPLIEFQAHGNRADTQLSYAAQSRTIRMIKATEANRRAESGGSAILCRDLSPREEEVDRKR